MDIFTQRFFNNKSIFYTMLVIFLLVIILLGLNMIGIKNNKRETIDIEINGKSISTIVSDDVKSRKDGLSILDEINDDEAMLFIFDEVEYNNFWMKDMKFSIDIVWLNGQKEVIYIKEHANPQDYPEVYRSDKKSLYVLEFRDGFVEKNNLQIGNKASWVY